MQPAGHFHHEVTDPASPEADAVLDHAAALDAAIDVLDPYAATGVRLIRVFLLLGEFPTAWLFDRLQHLDAIKQEGEKAQVLQQLAAFRQLVVGKIGNPFIGRTAFKRPTHKEDAEHRVHEQEVFNGVTLFLATIVALLLSRRVGARDGAFGAIVAKRGGAGSVSGVCGSVSGVGTGGGSVRRSSSWRITAAKSRFGASPIARRAVRSTGNSVCTH